MSIRFFDTVSARDLFDNAKHLSANIGAADDEARRVVASGGQIREAHDHGNINHSLESTCEGAHRVAEDLVDRVDFGQTREPFFGEHIREAVAALRPLWKKR